MAVNAHFRSITDRAVVPMGRGMVRLGLTANTLTTLGLLGVVVGMGVLLSGRPVLGGWIAALSTALDAFDGTVARLTNTQSELGAFYDSVADRVADATIFGACLWLARGEPLTFTLVMVALAAALITSYVRAKAESLGWDATVGLIERPERVVIILLAVGYGFLVWGAGILAVGGVITIVQRLHAVYGQATAVPQPSDR